MSFAYFSFNLLLAAVLYCFSDLLRATQLLMPALVGMDVYD